VLPRLGDERHRLRRGALHLPARRSRQNVKLFLREPLARISHGLSAAAADPGMFTALRLVGLLDVLSNTSAGLLITHLVHMSVRTASLRNPVSKAGFRF
jgi:hypothetical protein